MEKLLHRKAEWRVMFRLDANERLGYGHLHRCLALAGALTRRGGRAVFALARADLAAGRLITEAGYPWRQLADVADYGEEPSRWAETPLGRIDAVALDICHAVTFEQIDQIPYYISAMREIFGPTVLLDGLGEHALAARRPLRADLVVAPYPGADPLHPGCPGRQLSGPQYAVFPNALRDIAEQPREIQPVGNKILLTFGGGDPTRLTLLALDALSQINDRDLEIRLAVGSGFSPELRAAIDERAKGFGPRLVQLDAPRGLGAHMAWCDLALSATGLTKYELALTQTPSIQFSIDRTHDLVNRSFAATGTSLDLGLAEELPAETLAAACQELLDDPDARRAMAERGAALVDGRGAERIILEMETLIGARQ